MDPPCYKTETFPLQPNEYEDYNGQPGGSTVVHCTTVTTNTEPPKDHIIWSLLCFAYANPCCLGLAALIYSIKARDRIMAGDLEGARHHSTTARSYNIVSTVLVCIQVVVVIIVAIVLIVVFHNYTAQLKMNHQYNQYNRNTRYNFG